MKIKQFQFEFLEKEDDLVHIAVIKERGIHNALKKFKKEVGFKKIIKIKWEYEN